MYRLELNEKKLLNNVVACVGYFPDNPVYDEVKKQMSNVSVCIYRDQKLEHVGLKSLQRAICSVGVAPDLSGQLIAKNISVKYSHEGDSFL